ncbi:unnamed protein product [Didymodactylos carnosus]|uniref:SecA family profile domain-containing protein n=1 Tax=Didymodactylos carnosus TaxID=1234261 RepID=A0A8S2GN09_9BILA|nr:unnamed protein product [Didymodactylos carnosus]CAF3536946.1 unnamed protein product [Didymodactylos carnosus]
MNERNEIIEMAYQKLKDLLSTVAETTNLAGRGTDIKTDQTEKNGDLYVILTFMPSNKRVEEQAFGRTAQQGKRGTSQRILNVTNLIHYEEFDMQKITELRDRIEAKMLSDFEKYELKVIREGSDLVLEIKNKVKNVFTNVTPSVYESNVLLSIEEQWAMFLRKIDDQKSCIDTEKVHIEYAEFREKIIKDYNDDCVIKNPYYHIVIVNDFIINDSNLNSKYKQAMEHLKCAIKLDPKHSAATFAGKGWLLLQGKERFARGQKQDLGYKEAAIKKFHRALEVLSEEMAAPTIMQTLLQLRYDYSI